VTVLLLIDSSIPPQQIDLECVSWMVDGQVPFTLVFTKADKTKKKVARPEGNVREFLDILKKEYESAPDAFITSASDRVGAQPVLKHLGTLRELWVLAAEEKEAEN
jgi:GTP-binding protein